MSVITSRYSRALADVVFAQKLDPNQALQQLRVFVDLMRDNAALRKVWENPSIPAEQKRSLLDALVARVQVFRPVRNFLAVLIDHHRMHQLEEICQSFEHELHERLGLTEAQVTSARPLNDQEKGALEQQIAKLTGKRVTAKYATDSKLLGGAMVKVGSTVYDGSVRGQLNKIKEQLINQ
jgi:F-type H+-transporting ATPase subunit delta